MHKEGDVLDISHYLADGLVRNGLIIARKAAQVPSNKMLPPAPENKVEPGKSQAGGEAQLSSASLPAQALPETTLSASAPGETQPRPILRLGRRVRAAMQSASTQRSDSRLGPMSSTPATTAGGSSTEQKRNAVRSESTGRVR